MIVSLKFDLTKIDKAKLFKSKETGRIYLDATLLLNDKADEYGNHGMIVQQVTKEEREKGIKGAILGNAKIFSSESAPIEEDDLPF